MALDGTGREGTVEFRSLVGGTGISLRGFHSGTAGGGPYRSSRDPPFRPGRGRISGLASPASLAAIGLFLLARPGRNLLHAAGTT